MIEVWTDIPNYNGDYQISNLGRVNSFKQNKPRILSASINRKYLIVGLSNKGESRTVRVHILMAETFLNHKTGKNGKVVDHINNDKLDNRLDNLQLVTQQENCQKYYDSIRGTTAVKKKGSSSKYVGVYWNIGMKKWQCIIHIKQKAKHLGYFTDELKASQTYQNKLQTITNL